MCRKFAAAAAAAANGGICARRVHWFELSRADSTLFARVESRDSKLIAFAFSSTQLDCFAAAAVAAQTLSELFLVRSA